jgi:serine/threonine-protein kinase HipA
MAMALLGKIKHYLTHKIMRRHFNSTAKKVGYGNSAEPLIQDFIARTPAIVDKVRAELPAGFSEKVADRILGGVLAAAHALERMSQPDRTFGRRAGPVEPAQRSEHNPR